MEISSTRVTSGFSNGKMNRIRCSILYKHDKINKERT